jgi:hypothetical protein
MRMGEIAVQLLLHLCFLNIVRVGLLNTFLWLNKSSHSRCLRPKDARRLQCCGTVMDRMHGPGGLQGSQLLSE